MSDDLADAVGTPADSEAASAVMFRGRSVAVLPMTMRTLPMVARTLRGLEVPSALDASAIVSMIADHGDRVVQAVAAASGLTVDDVADAPLPEFVALTSAVIAVNADFFGQAVAAMAQALPQASGDGSTQPKP